MNSEKNNVIQTDSKFGALEKIDVDADLGVRSFIMTLVE